MSKSIAVRVHNLLVSFDQFVFCCITLGDSYFDETASGAAWRLEQNGKWQGRLMRPIIDYIFYKLTKQVNHCETSYNHELDGTGSVRFSVVEKLN